MRSVRVGVVSLAIALISTLFFSGCAGCKLCGPNWKEKYQDLSAEHESMAGMLESERAEKGQLAEQITQRQQTIEELQKQMEERKQGAAEATGFGPGYNVSLDAAAETMTVTLQNTILFDSGKATLKNAAGTELDHILSVLQSKYAGKQIDAVGHTDNQPIQRSKWKDNQELSEQRALSVKRYLVNGGISENLIQSIGKGDSMPVASNDTASERSANRRVEIVVHMK